MNIILVCPVCDTQYNANSNRLKYGRQTTCSRQCSYKLRADKQRTLVKLICSVCSKEFYRAPSQNRRKHQGIFCSPVCQYRGRSLGLTARIVTKPYEITESGRKALQEGGRQAARRLHDGNYRHSESTCAKLSQITAQRIACGKIKRVSQIESIVATALTAANINFVAQYVIRDMITGRYSACVDFYLPNVNIAIEVNGTFWHADPRFYDECNLAPAQHRTIERYTHKINTLRQLGIELREVWEYDLRKSPDDAIAKVLCGITH